MITHVISKPSKGWPQVALPGLPHYIAIFSWCSTFGGFALVVIYLLMAVGALRGLQSATVAWKLYLAAVVGILVSLAAIFGSIYKVAKPTIYAPWAALIVFVVGLALAFVVGGRTTAQSAASFSELAPAEQGAVKL